MVMESNYGNILRITVSFPEHESGLHYMGGCPYSYRKHEVVMHTASICSIFYAFNKVGVYTHVHLHTNTHVHKYTQGH